MSDTEPSAVEAAARAFWDALSSEPGGAETTVLVAFSGGPDSTVLLWSLLKTAPRRETIAAAHLDHGLDPRSGERADAAASLATRLGLPAEHFFRRKLHSTPQAGDEGVEAWARRHRYAYLREVALELADCDLARAVAVTAHHADDQAETVALRLLFGSGLRGMAGIRPSRSVDGLRVLRPLAAVGRAEIDATLAIAGRELPGLLPVRDDTNFDLRQPRARMRHEVLPRLGEPAAVRGVLCSVAAASRRCHQRLDGWLERYLAPRALGAGERFSFLTAPGVAVDLDAFRTLPLELRRQALAWLHAQAGSRYPPPVQAMAELDRQLASGGRVGVDCGDQLRWTVASQDSGRSELRLQRRIPARPFTYTFQAPGVADVPEIFSNLRFKPAEPRTWMFRGEVLRAGLALPKAARPVVEVRNRRPGDRLRPLGAGGSKRVKDLLIDHQVPRALRDRLPLLWLDGILAWVPGVTVDERFRIPPSALDAGPADLRVWVAEIRTTQKIRASYDLRASQPPRNER